VKLVRLVGFIAKENRNCLSVLAVKTIGFFLVITLYKFISLYLPIPHFDEQAYVRKDVVS
jgi:hypothetical protein